MAAVTIQMDPMGRAGIRAMAEGEEAGGAGSRGESGTPHVEGSEVDQEEEGPEVEDIGGRILNASAREIDRWIGKL